MEITEVKYEWQFGKYTALTWFGKYGTHTEWYKEDRFVDSDKVPVKILEQHEQKVEEVL